MQHPSDPEAHLEKRSQRAAQILSRIQSREKQISRLRLISFLIAAAAGVFFGRFGEAAGWSVFLAGMIPFTGLVVWHQKVESARKRWQLWKKHTDEDLARLRLKWDEIPLSEIPDPSPDHPYASDLNLTGPRSLTHLTDICVTTGGSELLASYLLHPDIDKAAILKRQVLIQDLTAIPYHLQKLRWTAGMQNTREKRWDTRKLLDWTHRPEISGLSGLFWILSGMCAITILLFLFWMIGSIPGWWAFTFMGYIAVYALNAGKVMHLAEEASDLHESMGRFDAVFRFLGKRVPRSLPHAYALTAPFRDAQTGPFKSLKRLRSIAYAGSIARNEVFFILLNAIFPWNAAFAWRLEQEKQTLRTTLPEWLDRWHEWEASASLAQLGVLNTASCFPEISDSIVWEAKEIAHPLILARSRISNNHTFSGKGDLGLITGSNMAGKSTFLRTVGLNTVLANAGAPVLAQKFTWKPARVFSSMKITDSVTEGYSYFFAEVRRLKFLHEALQAENQPPLLFIVDEIFKGTNTKERLIGSRDYIRALSTGNGFGLVATHDLELVKLSDEVPGIRNLHFEEYFADGTMHFSYQLKNGPCTSTNALHIMRQAGLPVQ